MKLSRLFLLASKRLVVVVEIAVVYVENASDESWDR